MEDAGVAEPQCVASLYDPAHSPGEATIRLGTAGGGPSASEWSAHFRLMNPSFPVDLVVAGELLPRYDFSLYVVDSQRFEAFAGGSPIVPGPLVPEPPQFYDPQADAMAAPTWADPVPGENALAVGFPAREENPNARLMSVVIGTVLDDAQAASAIEYLAQVGDAEGAIPYDPDVEVVLEGRAYPGMSGSGLFDRRGTQVGVVVRASFTVEPPHYFRAVRMRWIVGELERLRDERDPAERGEIAPFLPLD
jgi:hypothetical protein